MASRGHRRRSRRRGRRPAAGRWPARRTARRGGPAGRRPAASAPPRSAGRRRCGAAVSRTTSRPSASGSVSAPGSRASRCILSISWTSVASVLPSMVTGRPASRRCTDSGSAIAPRSAARSSRVLDMHESETLWGRNSGCCRLLSALWALVAAGRAATRDGAPSDGYADAAVAAWSGGDPVYVSPDSGALSADDADELRDRITGWRDDVFVAVLPATAIRQGSGDDADEASALIDDLYDGMGGRDGIYVVNLSGAGTYAAGYGDADGARRRRPDHGRPGRLAHPGPGRPDPRRHPRRAGRAGRGGVSVGWVVVGVLAGAAVATARDPGAPALAAPAAGPALGRDLGGSGRLPAQLPDVRRPGGHRRGPGRAGARGRHPARRGARRRRPAAGRPGGRRARAVRPGRLRRRLPARGLADPRRRAAAAGAGHRVRPVAAGLRPGPARRHPAAPAPAAVLRRRRATDRRSPMFRGRRRVARCDRSRSAGPATNGSPREHA